MAVPTPAEYAAILHAQLRPQALLLYAEFMYARTPPEWQDAMADLVEADLAAPFDPDPTKVLVSNGDALPITTTGAVAFGSAVATVAASAFVRGEVTPVATRAIVDHGANVVVQDNGGGVNAKSPGVADVTAHTLNFARLAA